MYIQFNVTVGDDKFEYKMILMTVLQHGRCISAMGNMLYISVLRGPQMMSKFPTT